MPNEKVDATADTIPCPDAPCDEPGCKHRWVTMVRVHDDKLYLCEDHADKARAQN